MDMFHYEKEDLYEGVEDIITVGDFYNKSQGAGTHILFI
jgi:peroxiredoxin family protein